jgi:hypothetical protein
MLLAFDRNFDEIKSCARMRHNLGLRVILYYTFSLFVNEPNNCDFHIFLFILLEPALHLSFEISFEPQFLIANEFSAY